QQDAGRALYFYDDINKDAGEMLFGKYPVLHSAEEARKHFNEKGSSFALGTGKPAVRRMMYEKFTGLGGKVETVISPLTVIGKHEVSLGAGCCVLSNCIIESTA